MGKAKRRKQLNRSFGKKEFIQELFIGLKNIFLLTSTGEKVLYTMIFRFFEFALKTVEPGATILTICQDLPELNSLSRFTGLPISMQIDSISLDDLMHVNFPEATRKELNYLIKKIDFSNDRLLCNKIQVGNKCEILFYVRSISEMAKELEKK